METTEKLNRELTTTALSAWEDHQSHQNLTHLINCLEDHPNPSEARSEAVQTLVGE